MALNAVYFAVLYLYSLIHCPAAEQNVDCRLVPTRTNVSSEFRLKATENGVRMVYLNLKIGNDSYHPLDVEDEFLPNRWVWANSISEPMLSLRFDYDILSLGLLTYQVRSMDVPLEDKPRGCLASLNSSCQNKVVGRVLLESVTYKLARYKTEVVCVTVIATTDYTLVPVQYPSCCSIETFGPSANSVQCDLTVKSSSWMDSFEEILLWLEMFAWFFLPAFPFVLPDYIFSLDYECDKEDRLAPEEINNGQAEVIPNPTRNGYEEITDCDYEEERLEIPVDDSSPLTCTTLLVGFVHHLPELRLSFNIKLAFLYYLLLPLVGYVHCGLWFAFKEQYILESYRKHVNLPGQSFVGVSPEYIALCFVPGLALVLFLRPKDLLYPHEMCPFCKPGTLFAELPHPIIYTPRANHSIGDEMLYHLKRLSYLPSLVWNIIQFHINGLKNLLRRCTCLFQLSSQSTSRTRRALGVSCALFSLLFTMVFSFVLGPICLILVLFELAFVIVVFSPFGSLYTMFWVKFWTPEIISGLCTIRSVAKSLMQLSFILFLPMFAVFITSLIVVVNMFGYLTMGLVLNADIVLPYLAFFFVAATNIYFCYANVQKKYKDFKGMTLKYWQKEQRTTNSDKETIPTHLFWFVSDRVLPVSTEVCLMVCSVTLIVIFLSLILLSVLFFRSTYNTSALVSTISVLISGVIPRLLFRGAMLKGWEKIKLKREIENAVKTFQEINGVNNSAMDSSRINGVEQV